MNKKPISPTLHGAMDYALASVLLLAPSVLGLSKKTVKTYRALGINLLTYNALTDFPAGIKPWMSLQTHKKIDYGNLATFAMMTMRNGIRNDKKALAFHAGVSAIAVANLLLTDWDNAEEGL